MAFMLFEGLDDGLLDDTEPQDHPLAGECSVCGCAARQCF